MTHPIQAAGEQQGRPQTLGEYRVGLSFNPSGDERVNAIKTICAHLIDYLEEQRRAAGETNAEVNRLLSLAQTHIEDAAMWGVKAVTKPKRD